MAASVTSVNNAETTPLRDVAELPVDQFREAIIAGVGAGNRLAALFGRPLETRSIELFAVLAHPGTGGLALLRTAVSEAYPSLTTECPQAHLFEREIAEQWGIRPEGHPWLKPVRVQEAHRLGGESLKVVIPDVQSRATVFFAMSGEEIHEVAVGPVHAGIIEPGHFRFQCHGEHVYHLEISLGYQHRGVERALVGGPDKRTIHCMETVAGDTSIGHATAYCEALEGLTGSGIPARVEVLRGIALELERIANHIGDLGALAGDIGYLPGASYCGRIRGDFLNLTALLCGSRFGRGLIRPGGTGFDVDSRMIAELSTRLDAALRDAADAVGLLQNAPSVQARFEDTGRLSRQTCESLGLVGPAARACGVEQDVRHDFPSGIFRFSQIPVSTWHTGDVFARAWIRWLEIQRSGLFIQDQLAGLPGGPVRGELGALPANQVIVSLVEGWRGQICHVAITDHQGRFALYKIVDPSFYNWMGLAIALRNQQISDFPLCNKSFNLSYCGHDL
ncbi:MAG: NADH-quinone oxidoreductase subunit C [Candidatus Binataceae bacterium]